MVDQLDAPCGLLAQVQPQALASCIGVTGRSELRRVAVQPVAMSSTVANILPKDW